LLSARVPVETATQLTPKMRGLLSTERVGALARTSASC
jgi:hypothetical protein